MTEEIEIEFKNLLTLEEYNKIYEFYNLDSIGTVENSNYYYDTKDELIKNNKAALRIRFNNDKTEMTLKIKGAKGNLEINTPIHYLEAPDILDVKNIDSSISEKLLEFGIKNNVNLFQKIVTERKELKLNSGLLVLDKNYYLNDIIDYELEFEVVDFEKGKVDFEQILEDLKISKKPTLPKIARAKNYT